MRDHITEQELKDRLSLIESHDRRGTPEYREMGMDVRPVGRCLLRRDGLVRVGP